MRLPNDAHEARPWVIATIAPEFDLLDVWDLPVEGGRDGFASFLAGLASLDLTEGSGLTRVLLRVRLRLGEWFGWDASKERSIPGSEHTSLVARLPDDLKDSASSVLGGTLSRAFTPLYQTDDEWAAEISNDTVHGVLQLAWVGRGEGRYRARMAIYVRPRGMLGAIYLRSIQPFRRLIVYPALTRQIGRAWDAHRRTSRGSPAETG